VKDSNVIF